MPKKMAALVLIPALAVAWSAAAAGGDAERQAPTHLEKPDDPPLTPTTPLIKSEAAVVVRDGVVSVQVNVDTDGRNIWGDAANEPSLAVDPTAPDRVVIGWRQFDTVNSNFRKAGWAWSHDGGRGWTFPGTLETIFRSDPVLVADADGWFYYYSLRTVGELIVCDLFLSDDGGQTWSAHIPAFGGDKAWVAVDRSGSIGHGSFYAAWSPDGGCCGPRVFTRSTDGGITYSDPVELDPAPSWGSMVVATDGELFIVGNASFDFERIVVARSLDARDPAADPTSFEYFDVDMGGKQPSFEGPNPGGLVGQVWIGVDTSDGPDRGALYVLSSINPPGADPCDVHFARSDDGGETWSTPVAVHPDDRGAWQWFGTMSVAPGGRIDAVWVESLGAAEPNIGELHYASSGDGGRTWSDSVPITPVFNSYLGWPRQAKLGDYYHMLSDDVGAHLAYAATFNGEQDVYYLRIGDYDCNGNAVADPEDIAAGTSFDCNGNRVPDECELAAGAAADSDGDGRLDECERPRRAGRR